MESDAEKTVLVHFGELARPVTFREDKLFPAAVRERLAVVGRTTSRRHQTVKNSGLDVICVQSGTVVPVKTFVLNLTLIHTFARNVVAN